jgi:hypothetical protein
MVMVGIRHPAWVVGA